MRRESTRGSTSAFVRAAVVTALVVPLVVVAAACSDGPATVQASPAPVRIGAIYNLSGGQSALDAPSLEGARLAVERINARGGLLGRRVELLERDGRTEETQVRRAAASLVAAGVSAIVGLSDTDQVLAAAPIAASAGVPFVTSGATSPRLPREIPNWLFLACFGDNAQAAASAQYAMEQLGATSTAVLYDEELDYTRLLARYFERSVRAQGGQVLASAGYGQEDDAVAQLAGEGTNDEEDDVEAGAAAEADVLFVAAAPEAAAALVRQLRRAGYTQPIMGGDSFDSSGLVAVAKKTGGKVYYTTHAALGMSSASLSVRRFAASFEAAYGRPPENAFAGLGYDAVGLVASAVRRAESVKPSDVRDAIQTTHRYRGVTGTLSYQGDDRVPHKRVTLVCVGRRPVVVAQFTPGYVAQP
jgi:branched-chain amino acid transport system substrate-binding protein